MTGGSGPTCGRPQAKQSFVGFDSAWTDNPRQLGAICSLTRESGEVIDFTPPRLVSFQKAAEFVEIATRCSDFTLVAIDQPTRVPNQSGCRPVDRVAGSVLGRLRGGVQPANRSKRSIFGDGAPVWRFLDEIGARQDPPAARNATSRLYLIEVFPALALPALAPELWDRSAGAKYNPANRKSYSHADWKLVAHALASFARKLEAWPLVEEACAIGELVRPSKADQDKLDSMLCLAVALAWRFGERGEVAVIGDGRRGYIVTPCHRSDKAPS